MVDADQFAAVDRHYGREDLGERILETLREQGKALDALTVEDIAPLTHLSGRQQDGTVQLGRLAELRPGLELLDLGSGVGGPAMTLATEFGCRVTGLDLTESFVRTAQMLTERVGLAEQVSFRHGNALEMPFPSASFDVVWHEQFAMHIEDKPRLYREVHRVLRPAGRLVLREFMAGSVQPIHFPVPWASEPSISFLWPSERLRALLAETGFVELLWDDFTAADLARRRQHFQPAARSRRSSIFLGPDIDRFQQNMAANYAEDRLRIVQAVYQRA